MNSETYDQLFRESEEARALLREMSRQIVIDQSVPTGCVMERAIQHFTGAIPGSDAEVKDELISAQEWLERQRQRKKNPNNQKRKRRRKQ